MTIVISVLFVWVCLALLFFIGYAIGDHGEAPAVIYLFLVMAFAGVNLTLYAMYCQGVDAAKLAGGV